MEQKQTPQITFTLQELTDQGYVNPQNHPSLDTNVANARPQDPTSIEVVGDSEAPTTIEVRDEDLPTLAADALRLAAARTSRPVSRVRVDGTTGVVLTPGEAAAYDRGAPSSRS